METEGHWVAAATPRGGLWTADQFICEGDPNAGMEIKNGGGEAVLDVWQKLQRNWYLGC